MILTSFRLPFSLPTLNELEAARGKVAVARGAGDDTRWNAYNEKKRKLQADVVVHILSARVPRLPPDQRVRVGFAWYCLDRRSDPDNISAGGRKIIMDAMARHRAAGKDRVGVSAGIIHCDGWHCVAGFCGEDFFAVDHSSKVGVVVRLEAAP